MKIAIDENVSYGLVENCFYSHDIGVFRGKLVTLYKGGMRFRQVVCYEIPLGAGSG